MRRHSLDLRCSGSCAFDSDHTEYKVSWADTGKTTPQVRMYYFEHEKLTATGILRRGSEEADSWSEAWPLVRDFCKANWWFRDELYGTLLVGNSRSWLSG